MSKIIPACRTKKALIILFSCLFFSNMVFGQKEKFKALFIYNFTRYIEWPSKSKHDFKIAIMGDGDLFAEMKVIAEKMKGSQNTIVVVKAGSAEEINDCQIVYIAKSHFSELPKTVAKAKASNILIITEGENACSQGAGINFINKNGNLNFEVSKVNLQASGLKVNADLLALGKVVD